MVGGRGSYRGCKSRHREPTVRFDGRELTFTRKGGVTRSEDRGAGELDSGGPLAFPLTFGLIPRGSTVIKRDARSLSDGLCLKSSAAVEGPLAFESSRAGTNGLPLTLKCAKVVGSKQLCHQM